MSGNIVMLTDPYGGPAKPYRRLSARVPEFLERYPVHEGYRVITSAKDALSYQSGLLELLKAAVAAGKKIGDIGYETPLNTMIFTAELCDREGVVLANATSNQVVSVPKDWEKGETAALQRLLAKLGFGGELLDHDENADFESIGLSYASAVPSKDLGTVALRESSQASPPPPPMETVTEEAIPDPLPVETPTNEVVTQREAKNELGEEDEDEDDNLPATPAMLKQVKNLARLRGVPTPVVQTQAEAASALRELMKPVTS